MTDGAPTLGVQSLAYAGLDALLAALPFEVPFELCAYLHVGEELGPQLYLRRPTLAELDPNDAFRLFSALRDQLDDPAPDDRRVRVDGFDAVMVVSAGAHSRGLWVVGRRDAALTEREANVAGDLGRAIMRVCHLAESTALSDAPASVVRVSLETSASTMRAEVVVERGGTERTGHGEATSSLGAVALAALDAVDPSLKLVAADEDGISDARAVLVLVRDGVGRQSVGASLVAGDPLRAAAAAAVVAATSFDA